MALRIELQNEDSLDGVPPARQFESWVGAALQQPYPDLEQTIRIVDLPESRALNRRYRDVDAATNVLAFPGGHELLDYACLGDLVICAPVVAREAAEQGKAAEAHWAHMVVHGILHLQGFDHRDDAGAAHMEALEIIILDTLGYTNPYND